MNIHQFIAPLIRPFRKRRMDKFMARFAPGANHTILDVGGTPYNWDIVDFAGNVVLLNLELPPEQPSNPRIRWVVGDGTRLDYADESFDIVFSNSVIEHVGSPEQQRRFASELCRVGKRVFVQTPAKSFWLEPHYLTPFVHYLPTRWQKKLLRNFSVWGWLARPSQEYVDNFVDQTRLLGDADMRRMFPGCRIERERFLGMTKSYVAVKGLAGQASYG